MFRQYKKGRYSNFKLTYFNMRGRCEGIRYLFAAAEIPFEDNRITGEEWAKLKQATPFGSLPMLEVDGCCIGQSLAVGRFVANIGGLGGDTPTHQAMVDGIADSSQDLREGAIKLFQADGETEEKNAAIVSFIKEKGCTALQKLEAIIEANGKNYFVGNKLSLADIWFFHCMELVSYASGQKEDLLEPYTNLNALYKRVETIPSIAEYIKNRPQTH